MTTVKITLGEKSVDLVPTLRAAKIVSEASEGFSGIFQKVQRFQMSAFTLVIAAGTDTKSDYLEALEESIYANGLEPLAAPVSRFISILMNGGRDPALKTSKPKDGSEKK